MKVDLLSLQIALKHAINVFVTLQSLFSRIGVCNILVGGSNMSNIINHAGANLSKNSYFFTQ